MAKVESIAVLEKVNTGAELTKEETQAVLEGEITEPGTATAEPEVLPPAKKEEPKEKVTTGADKPAKKESDAGEKEDAGKKDSSKEVLPPKDDKQKGEEPAKVEAPKAEDWVEKSEKELKKPEGEEDLTNFSPREKGLFYELRQTRRRAQRAEAEARDAEYKLFQSKQADKAKQAPEELTKIFEGKEEDDLLTVADAKKILKHATQPAKSDEHTNKQIAQMKYEVGLMKLEKNMPDAPQVLGLLDELLDNEEPYSKMAREEVVATYQRNGNFVKVLYNFIKGHPKFPEYEARLKNPDGVKADSSAVKDPDLEEKKERAKKLEENQLKAKTTGGAGGGETHRADEYSEQELAEMTPAQWKKLPEKTRRKLLEG